MVHKPEQFASLKADVRRNNGGKIAAIVGAWTSEDRDHVLRQSGMDALRASLIKEHGDGTFSATVHDSLLSGDFTFEIMA